MRSFLSVSLIAVMVALPLTLPSSARAQPSLCMKHDEMARKLRRDYKEYQVGIGVGQRGATMVELWVSQMGTFTVIVVRPDGMGCIVASGDGWASRSLEPGEDL